MKSLIAMVQPLRRMLRDHARLRVLVIGDSHVKVFDHWLFLVAFPRTHFDVVYVPGGTAMGIRNRHSQTDAYNRFLRALEKREHDLVLLNLGEVDAAYTIWLRAQARGVSVPLILDYSVTNYCAFIDEVRADHRLVVMSAPLPTLSDQGANSDKSVSERKAVKASQAERTAMTLELNRRVRAHCEEHGVSYLSSDRAALGPDGLVRRDWLNSRAADHHYARTPYARWLVGELRGVLGAAARQRETER